MEPTSQRRKFVHIVVGKTNMAEQRQTARVTPKSRRTDPALIYLLMYTRPPPSSYFTQSETKLTFHPDGADLKYGN